MLPETGNETRNENGTRNGVERFRLQETRREKNNKTEGSQNCNEQIQKFRYIEQIFCYKLYTIDVGSELSY